MMAVDQGMSHMLGHYNSLAISFGMMMLQKFTHTHMMLLPIQE